MWAKYGIMNAGKLEKGNKSSFLSFYSQMCPHIQRVKYASCEMLLYTCTCITMQYVEMYVVLFYVSQCGQCIWDICVMKWKLLPYHMHTSMHNMTTSTGTASSLVYFGPLVPQKTFVSEDEWTEKTLASEDAVYAWMLSKLLSMSMLHIPGEVLY